MKITKLNYYRSTPYGELTIFGDQPIGTKEKNRTELMKWCKTISSSLIYIWIDKSRLSQITVQTLIQVFLDLSKHQPKAKIIVQWRMESNDVEMQSVVNSLQSLFPKLSFIKKEA